jgi:Na+-driven multidrug efflux pump
MSYLPLVLFALLMLIVLMWGFYEVLYVASTGRWRPSTIVALMAVSLVFLFLLAVGGDIDYLWEIPDAVACADNAELVMEAVPGPAAGGLGDVQEWYFLGCTAYWYA